MKKAKEEDGAVVEGIDVQAQWDTSVHLTSALTSGVADGRLYPQMSVVLVPLSLTLHT